MTDATLYTQWTAGDRRAGQELFNRHEEQLMAWIKRHIHEDASDVFQATWLAAREGGKAGYRGPGSFQGWLQKVARTQSRRQRKRTRAPAWDQRSATSPSRRVLRSQAAEAIESISHDEIRDAARQHWIEDREPSEIAALQGVPASTVYSRLRRAAEQVRDVFR